MKRFVISLLVAALLPLVAFAKEGPAIANVAASQTDSSLVTAVTGARIAVHQVAVMTGATATNVTFNTKPSGAGTAISPTFQCGANGGIVLPYSEKPWFYTSAGEGLSVTTGTGSTTGIVVYYRAEP